MITRKSTKGMSYEDWLEERRGSIGGSDLGAIMGLSDWATPYSVWAEKTGRIPAKEPTESMRIGTDLEPYVADRFCEVTGLSVNRVNYILKNSDFPHIHANIDRNIRGLNAGLECKTASAFNAGRFADGNFPKSYYAQCVAYMAITGKPKWYLAVLVMGTEFKIFRLTREKDAPVPAWCESSVYVDDEVFDTIRDAAARFWDCVEKDIPPDFDGLDPTDSALKEIYRKADKDAKEVNLSEFEAQLNRWSYLKQQEDILSKEKKAIEQSLKDALKEAEKGKCGNYTVNWDSRTRKSFDHKRYIADNPDIDFDKYYGSSTSRYFSIKEAKNK